MDLQEINKWLRWGDKLKIAEMGDFEYSSVIKALKGKPRNSAVIPIAEMFAKRNKQAIEGKFKKEYPTV